ncbi:hypothetical protein H8959_006170, partial [Pygathrix nigripes]
MPREAVRKTTAQKGRTLPAILFSSPRNRPLLGTTSPVSLRGGTSYPGCPARSLFPPPRGPRAPAAAWRPTGQVGFPGEAAVEAEEAAAETWKQYLISLNWLILAWKIHL